MKQLIENVAHYVSDFLKEHLSPDLLFHNITHTYEVVAVAKEIGSHCNLSENEMSIVQTAAWFHDCGYSKAYTGHEEESKKIAEAFLIEQNCSRDFIIAVLNCIEATRYPQRPRSLVEEVLCDADLYHFTRANYPEYAKAIRYEFEKFLGLIYTDKEWRKNNCDILVKHHYFTKYGKIILTKFKEVNIRLLAKADIS